jgi:hypothetical protein
MKRTIGLNLATLVLLALGCPADDTGTTGESSDGSGSSTGTPATTVPATTAVDPDSSSGEPPATTTATDTGPDTMSSTGEATGASTGTTSDTDGDTDGTTTGGVGLCEVMLPPPPMCAAPGVGFPGTPNLECDPVTQTGCPAGEKCMPWANDGGGSWNATRCSPIDPVPNAIGDACTVQGSAVSGIDDCEEGAMCWNVDGATNLGTCIELCGCAYATPICQTANTTCSISNQDSLPICTPVCNPLDPMACDAGQGCYPVGGFFQCAPDASGMAGAPGDACGFINGCDPGVACVGAGSIPGCPGAVGCCAATCDVDDPAPACDAGTACTEWFAPGSAPDMCLETIGVCIAP